MELSWIQGSRSNLSEKLQKVGSHGLCRPWLPAAHRVWDTTSLGATARPTDAKNIAIKLNRRVYGKLLQTIDATGSFTFYRLGFKDILNWWYEHELTKVL